MSATCEAEHVSPYFIILVFFPNDSLEFAFFRTLMCSLIFYKFAVLYPCLADLKAIM